MRLVSHMWSGRNWTLGDAQIECNCGNTFSVEKLVLHDSVECPECGRQEEYVSCRYVSYGLMPKFEETTIQNSPNRSNS
jgi:hypothetical protein